jgi:hypothetical protein
MSLSLIQGDSSVEEEEAAATDEEEEEEDYQKLSEEEGHSSSRLKISYKAPSNGSSSSILPSAMYAFSQVGYLLKFLFWIISRHRGLGFFFLSFFWRFQGRSSFLVILWESMVLELIIIRISKGSTKRYGEITIINRRTRRKVCLLVNF